MARPIKTGLDYFPLDVSIDDNVELLEAECGLVGFAIIIKLWQKIFSNGYYIDWNEDNAMLFARKVNSELTLVNTVVNVCLRRNLFDKNIFNEYNVLTSSGIQKRYFKICTDSKRKGLTIYKEYQLINPELIGVNTELIPLNIELSTQSKVKEIKEEEIKKDNTIIEPFVSKFASDSEPRRLTELLIYLITDNNEFARVPDTPNKLENWIIEIDRMIRKDGINIKLVEGCINWCQNDSFWKSNILSASKLRKQFPQLYAKAKSSKSNDKSDFVKQVELMEDW